MNDLMVFSKPEFGDLKTGSYSMPGTDPTPTSAECLQAVAELRRLGMADEASVRNILKQGGFAVEGAAFQPGQRLGGAVPDAAPDPGLVDAFLAYVLPRAKWDLLPFTFLFPLYERWMARDRPGVALLGRNTFIKRVRLLAGRYGWTHKKGQAAPGRTERASCKDWSRWPSSSALRNGKTPPSCRAAAGIGASISWRNHGGELPHAWRKAMRKSSKTPKSQETT